jgi:hypothetical protein
MSATHVVQNGDGSTATLTCEEYQRYVENASWFFKYEEAQKRLESLPYESLEELTETVTCLRAENAALVARLGGLAAVAEALFPEASL